LQALRAKFNLLVNSSTSASTAAAAAKSRRWRGSVAMRSSMGLASATSMDGEQGGCDSVLTYEGFLGFWAEAGLKDWLSKVRSDQ
jgi:hypothetical protein